MSGEIESSAPAKPSPAFQFYAQDFLVGVATMSPAAVGGYMRLLCYQWVSGGLKKDRKLLRALCGCGGRVLDEILTKFEENSDGFLLNLRLEKTRDENLAFRKKQSDNAKSRWGEGERDAKPMPPHMPERCSSSSVFKGNTLSTPGGADSRVSKKPHERNELLDALASCNGSDPLQVTRSGWGAIAKALAEIKVASPGVTADEIRQRSRRYRQLHRDWTLTATALSKHWGELAGHGTQPTAADDEPHDYLERIRQTHPHLIEQLRLDCRTWNSLPSHVKESVKSALANAG